MDNSNFYVDLPSDASMEKYPSNYGGDFTVELPFALTLSSHQWEVGLVEAIFNQEWTPIQEKDLWVQICISGADGEFGECEIVYADLKNLQNINMDSFEEICEKLLFPLFTKAFKNAKLIPSTSSAEHVKIEQSSTTKCITLKIELNQPSKSLKGIRMELSQVLLRIFGFTAGQLSSVPKGMDSLYKDGADRPPQRFFYSGTDGNIITPISSFPPSVWRAVSTLWIYSDIVKPHFTGHTLSPLLRVIATDDSIKRTTVRLVRFTTVDYYPLKYDNIREIRIKITNQAGLTPIMFSNPIILKLHFRRRKV